MVFTSMSSAVFKVLDGQQRLATTLMLFSAVRNWLRGYDAFAELSVQVQEYLGTKELGSPVIEPRLSLTPANNDAFQRYVVTTLPATEIGKALKQIDERSKPLLKAVVYVNRFVEKLAEQYGAPEKAKEHFLSVLKYLADQVQVVRFVLGSDDAAYTIFETLNDRGQELSPLDLVKNYLFSHAEKYRTGSLREFEERWTGMMALLSSPRADSFLRAFWTARHGKPEGAKLFTAFKKAYSDPAGLYNVSVELRRDAERYAALFSSHDSIWSEYAQSARQSVDALGIIGFTQSYPMILAALSTFNKREMERLLWLIECVAVRHQLIGRRRPGRVESLGGRAAKDISDGKLTTATEVLAVIKELYVPDDEFKIAFAGYEESSAKKIRYLLAGIERESVSRDNSTLSGELGPSSVTVEHIFPRSPSPEWVAVAHNDSNWDDRLITRLGNLCLLPGINHSLGNKNWADKAEVYRKSRLVTTKALSQHQKWDREEITTRQMTMAKLAASAWMFQ